jgi:positive regulator of sigma E activity
MGALKVADTSVPVTMFLLLLVLVGVFLAPLLGFVELTITACARVGNANPVKTAASGSAASQKCGFKELLKLFIFLLFHRVTTTVDLEPGSSICPAESPTL